MQVPLRLLLTMVAVAILPVVVSKTTSATTSTTTTITTSSATPSAESASYCLSTDPKPSLLLGSKTPYNAVRGSDSDVQEVPGCAPVTVWHISRHGVKYPGTREMRRMEVRLPVIKKKIVEQHSAGYGELCPQDVAALASWHMATRHSLTDLLTAQGEKDMTLLAQRMRARFPELLGTRFSNDAYVFRHTESERTRSSALWYSRGLFGENTSVPIPQATSADRKMLLSYQLCPRWNTGVAHNASVVDALRAFEESKVAMEMMERVSRRLGLEASSVNLTYEDVDDIWTTCGYDKAIKQNETSPWCAAFTEQDMQVLRYRGDLRDFLINGYGYDINANLGCPLVKDLVDRFGARVTTDKGPVASAYFTDSEALLLTLTRLGLARDEERLSADTYSTLGSQRQWNASRINPFAANLAVVLFRCRSGDEYRVRFYLNEVPVDIPTCPNSDGLCSWKALKGELDTLLEECTLNFCRSAGAWSLATSWVVAGATLLLLHKYPLL